MICEHDKIAFLRQQVGPESRRAYIYCTNCLVQGEMNLDELDEFEWPEMEYSNQHHFEVIVSTTGDRVGYPSMDGDLAGSWREGTIYNLDTESWTSSYGGDMMANEAEAMLVNVLRLPMRLAEMMDECSDGGSWIGGDICEELCRLLEFAHVQQKCDRCGLLRASSKKKCWCEQ